VAQGGEKDDIRKEVLLGENPHLRGGSHYLGRKERDGAVVPGEGGRGSWISRGKGDHI